jgi:hypothetical protein
LHYIFTDKSEGGAYKSEGGALKKKVKAELTKVMVELTKKLGVDYKNKGGAVS